MIVGESAVVGSLLSWANHLRHRLHGRSLMSDLPHDQERCLDRLALRRSLLRQNGHIVSKRRKLVDYSMKPNDFGPELPYELCTIHTP